MWFQSQSTMQKRGREIVAGPQKAVVELASVMTKELDVDSVTLLFLTEDDMKKRIAAVRGGSISYESFLLTETESRGKDLKRWLRREIWWLLATTVFVGLTCTIWLAPTYYYAPHFWYTPLDSLLISLGPTLGLLVALCIGTLWKSRMFFILLITTLIWIAPLLLSIV
jgi:hypothetical protein